MVFTKVELVLVLAASSCTSCREGEKTSEGRGGWRPSLTPLRHRHGRGEGGQTSGRARRPRDAGKLVEGRTRIRSRAHRPGFKSWLYRLPAGRPWSSLSRPFLTCGMGVGKLRIVPSLGCGRILGVVRVAHLARSQAVQMSLPCPPLAEVTGHSGGVLDANGRIAGMVAGP